MRQVPKYLIIGDGKAAHHFQHYLSLLKLPFHTWHRKQSLEILKQLLIKVSHVLLLISDNAIESIAIHCKAIAPQLVYVHFSGSLFTSYAFGVHPLTSFNSSLYTLVTYQKIPFIIDNNAPKFTTLLPGLSNSHVYINTEIKAKYHALCVLSGNFSCMLWQKFFYELETTFNIPASIAYPYLMQLTHNLMHDHTSALTGPLARSDRITIARNLNALENDPFQSVYQSFVECYQSLEREKI